jgi:hypothetical protein
MFMKKMELKSTTMNVSYLTIPERFSFWEAISNLFLKCQRLIPSMNSNNRGPVEGQNGRTKGPVKDFVVCILCILTCNQRLK